MLKLNNIWDKYKKIEIIGLGAFGDVYRGKINKEYVAIKEIKKLKTNEKKFVEETEIMKIIESDNSVKLIERVETEDSFYIISELCDLSLEEYLNKRKESLSIEEIKELLIDLNKGLKVMYENKIMSNML